MSSSYHISSSSDSVGTLWHKFTRRYFSRGPLAEGLSFVEIAKENFYRTIDFSDAYRPNRNNRGQLSAKFVEN